VCFARAGLIEDDDVEDDARVRLIACGWGDLMSAMRVFIEEEKKK
jgi:hypothetical protein